MQREDDVDHYGSMTQLLACERAGVDYTLQLEDRGDAVTVLAPHGGELEVGAAELAQAVAGDTHNFYAFNPHTDGDNYRLHVTSIRFDEPSCCALLDRSFVAVSIHGCESYRPNIILGGRNVLLKSILAEELGRLEHRVMEHPRFAGVHRKNIVNRPLLHGVQLELTDLLRAELFDDFTDPAGRRLNAAGWALARAIRGGLARYRRRALQASSNGSPPTRHVVTAGG